MPISRCRVSHTDLDGVNHAVEVEAQSLYEAVALTAVEFRLGEIITDTPGAMAEFCVTLLRQAVPVGEIILLEIGCNNSRNFRNMPTRQHVKSRRVSCPITLEGGEAH